MDVLNGIEELLSRLEGGALVENGTDSSDGDTRNAVGESNTDAIDAVNASPPRSTATRRLRDAEVMQRFCAEMAEGLVRSDTVKGVFDLLGQVLDAVFTRWS